MLASPATFTIALKKYSESLMWTVALLALFFMNSSSDTRSLCLFKLFGLNSCWGCGIGHSVNAALHFQFKESFNTHMFGIPATLVILHNIFKPFLNRYKTN